MRSFTRTCPVASDSGHILICRMRLRMWSQSVHPSVHLRPLSSSVQRRISWQLLTVLLFRLGYIHDTQRIKPNDFGDLLSFPQVHLDG